MGLDAAVSALNDGGAMRIANSMNMVAAELGVLDSGGYNIVNMINEAAYLSFFHPHLFNDDGSRKDLTPEFATMWATTSGGLHYGISVRDNDAIDKELFKIPPIVSGNYNSSVGIGELDLERMKKGASDEVRLPTTGVRDIVESFNGVYDNIEQSTKLLDEEWRAIAARYFAPQDKQDTPDIKIDTAYDV